MRYRLQRKEQYAMPNVLGNHSFPVYTYRWKDVAISDDKGALESLIPIGSKEYRIEDTEPITVAQASPSSAAPSASADC